MVDGCSLVNHSLGNTCWCFLGFVGFDWTVVPLFVFPVLAEFELLVVLQGVVCYFAELLNGVAGLLSPS